MIFFFLSELLFTFSSNEVDGKQGLLNDLVVGLSRKKDIFNSK